nr:LEPR-XLL domain-containing protein [Burkholderiales bacterium]
MRAAASVDVAGAARPPVRRRPLLEALESRLLLSADLPGIPVPDPAPIMALSEPADTQGPRVVASFVASEEADVVGFVLVFDENVLPSSVDASDVLSIIGPDGASLTSSIVSVQAFVNAFDGSSRFLGIEITPIAGEGEYVLSLGAAITDAAGNAIDPMELRLQFAPPDLQPVSLSAPPTAEPGGVAMLSWLGRNARPGTSMDGSWTDRIWLSTDDRFDRATDVVVVDAFVFVADVAGPTWSGFASVPISTTPGTYWLFLEVNGQGFGSDRSFADNLLLPGHRIEVRAPSPANLVVTDIVAPSTAVAGETVEIAWTTENRGDRTAGGGWFGWVDEIWLSGEDGTTPEVLLGQFTVAESLMPGGSTTTRGPITIPDLPGNRRIIVRTDVFGGVDEGDGEADNTTVDDGSILITMPPLPDLVVENLVVMPTTFDYGTRIRVDFDIVNRGTAAGGSGRFDKVWLSRDAVLDADDLSLGDGFDFRAALEIGEARRLGFFVTPPLSTDWGSGPHFILVEADSSFGVRELDERNNVTAVAVEAIAPPSADLVVESITAPAGAWSGDVVTVRWLTHNRGTLAASGFVERLVLYIGDQPVASTDTPRFSSSLAAGTSVERSAQLTIPVEARGAYRFRVVTDATNQVFERGGERNNVAIDDADTVVTTRPLPDLVVTDITAPTAVVNGQPLTLRYTVTNRGTASTEADALSTTRIVVRPADLGLPDAAFGSQLINIGGLAVGASRSFEVRFDSTPEGRLGDSTFVLTVD